MKANSTIFAMLTTITFSSLFALSPEKVKSEAATLYEIGINLGMGRGCKKDPKMALETMKASARLGYGPAALVCAMAMEAETGWMAIYHDT